MAENKKDYLIPRQSLIYMALCLTGVLIFVFAGILPAGRELKELDAAIDSGKYGIAEQTALAPFWKHLKDDIDKKDAEILPLPPQGKLPQNELGTLHVVFDNAAKKCGMTLVSAIPHLPAMTGDAPFVPINVVLRGGVRDFRKFLIEIGGIPYVQHIEEITIQEKGDTREFKMKIWAAVG